MKLFKILDDYFKCYAATTDYKIMKEIENKFVLIIVMIVYLCSIVFVISIFKPFDHIPYYNKLQTIAIYLISFIGSYYIFKKTMHDTLRTVLTFAFSMLPYVYVALFLKPYMGDVFIYAFIIYLLTIAIIKSSYLYYSLVLLSTASIVVYALSDFFLNRNPKISIFMLIAVITAFIVTVLIGYALITLNKMKAKAVIANNILLERQKNKLLELYHEANDKTLEVEYAYLHDCLTGLPNRLSTISILKQKIERAKKDTFFAVLFIDLDSFKYVNEILESQIGDLVLVQFAKRLEKILKEDEFVGRAGGDEYIVILNCINDKEKISQRVAGIHRCLQRPIYIKDFSMSLRCSIGVALYPLHAKSAESLLNYSEVAMHGVKENGRNNIAYYTSRIESNFKRKSRIIAEFKRAIDEDGFTLMFQPIISSKTHCVTGFETLLRWQSMHLGLVSPTEFIPIAEASGAMVPIGCWVIEHALMAYNAICKKLNGAYSIAINISSYQIENNHFESFILKMIEKYQVMPNRLVLEVTEGTVLRINQKTLALFEKLRKKGIRIALDDVGAGYFSFDYLRQMSLDMIKLDKGITQSVSMPNSINRVDFTIAKGIVEVCRQLNIEIVAEGVENEVQLNKMKQISCHYLQGYAISKPLLQDELIDFLNGY